ncbi:glycosyltransferase [Actinopolyspora sp. H202]|uniref:glycosyltransferase n=1 Tax=Actinopolyspora sp. H202 TaxID=1500456 RepID=UPI003EE6D05A
MNRLNLIFLLDSPNIWRGRALAGTPARVLALAESAAHGGAEVTLLLCDRGADYGRAADWTITTALVHPADFYKPALLADVVSTNPDFLVICEAEAILTFGDELAQLLRAQLVYDVHDDDAEVAASLGEPAEIVRRHASAQQGALQASDRVLVSTHNEAKLVHRHGIASGKTALVPNGAHAEHHIRWGPTSEPTTLTFVGNLHYAPNGRAVTFIRDHLTPALREFGTPIRTRIIGNGPSELDHGASDIVHLGRVPSVNTALRGTTLALAPLSAGSGAKMKVLDYLAAGLPVLGTSEAVTGLPPDRPGVIVNDDLPTWPQRIHELVSQPSSLRLVGEQGRRCAENELSWQRIGAKLVEKMRTWHDYDTRESDIPLRNNSPHLPRWMSEHAAHNALPEPSWTAPGEPYWLLRMSRFPRKTNN